MEVAVADLPPMIKIRILIMIIPSARAMANQQEPPAALLGHGHTPGCPGMLSEAPEQSG